MIDGSILIDGGAEARDAGFAAVSPVSGETLEPRFGGASLEDADRACALAEAAFDIYRATDPDTRAAFLEAIAEEILGIGDPLIERAMIETGLPRARLEGERGRTVGQLRLFASNVRQGDWLGVTIDPALPDRAPLPRPDLRLQQVPLGPVVVFGASNFPLAFSVAGGDTASALAAGCPVIVKGHQAHPGTGELIGRAIQRAVAKCGLPAGVFALLPSNKRELGSALVADPRVKAVGFTGSRGGGLALVKIAQARPEPIPVYAEMSSINPVILFPAALKVRGAALGPAFVQSLTMGAGQFCTNPGVVIAVDGPELEAFVAAASEAMTGAAAATMLSPLIHSSYAEGVDALAKHAAVETVARGLVGEGANQGQGALFSTTAAKFLSDRALGEEVFGSSSIIVRCADLDEVSAVLRGMEGQLTITLQMDDADVEAARALLPLLETKAGRILANGWPTGVEVSHAMVHGGPFPATSDSRTTSVGSLAITRFLRPVSYQNLPAALLPTGLADANPWKLARRIDGVVQAAG